MWAIFGSIMGGAALLGVTVAIAEPTFWPPTFVMGLILAVVLSWLGTTTLTLEDDAIRYRSLFIKRDIPLIDVAKAEFTFGFSDFKPYQRVSFILRDKPDETNIVINAGLFDPTQITQWVSRVNARLQQLT
jgi:hypothetical protein